MTKISATLPLDVVKGSVKQRYAKIKLANKILFDKIMLSPEDLSLKRAGELLSETFVPDTGHRLNVQVKSLDVADATGATQTSFVNGKPVGYTVMVHTKADGTISKAEIPNLMHEATHVHQLVFEPKIMARISSLDLSLKEEKRVTTFFHNVLNTNNLLGFFNEPSATIRMKLALRGLDDTEKLNVMDLMKNHLRMERLAHLEGERYAYKAAASGVTPNEVCPVDDFLFEDKIDFIEKEIAKHIKKMRKK